MTPRIEQPCDACDPAFACFAGEVACRKHPCSHRWDTGKLTCADCGALGCYAGSVIVALRCACGADAVVWVAVGDHRCRACFDGVSDDDDDSGKD